MNADNQLDQAERELETDDSEAAAIRLDLIRVRAGKRPQFVAWCQLSECGALIWQDDKGTGDCCETCHAWFCDEHGHPRQSHEDFERDVSYDSDAQCKTCHDACVAACRRAEEEDMQRWWDEEGREEAEAEQAMMEQWDDDWSHIDTEEEQL